MVVTALIALSRYQCVQLSLEKEKFVEEPISRAGEDNHRDCLRVVIFFVWYCCSLECFPFKSSFLKFTGKRVVIIVCI